MICVIRNNSYRTNVMWVKYMAENQVDASLRSLFNPYIITRNTRKNVENVDCLFRNIFFEVSVDSVLVVSLLWNSNLI